MTLRPWYRVEAKTETPEVADLYVFDAIGKSFWDDNTVTAKQFVADLAKLPESVKTLRVHVNSPGGDVFDAVAIANALRAQRTEKNRTVDVSIEGLAASAATIVTSAGSPIRIADNAMMMIHDPSAIVWGPAAAMRKMAGVLEQVRDSIIATYRWVSPKSAEDLAALMAATTWMTAAEAVEHGLATQVVEAAEVAASLRPEILASLGDVPQRFRGRLEALVLKPPVPPPAASAAEILRECKAAGCLELAERLIGAGASLADVRARLEEEERSRTAREARAVEIRALCATAKLPELADGLIRGAMAIADVKAHLTTITARMDKAEIDAHLAPGSGSANDRGPINAIEVYRVLNGIPAAMAEGARRP